MRDTRTAYRARAAATERSIDAALVEMRAAKEAAESEARAAYAKRTAPVPFTEAELKVARVIRTAYGWYAVVRVNAKTVTAKDGRWNASVPRNSILEVRA